MSAPDTSTDAIGALALGIGAGALCGDDKCRVIRVGDCACASIDATLRALAAERDTANAACDASVKAALAFVDQRDKLAKSEEFWRECSDAFEHDWKRAEADRDAARAEVAALKAIIDEILDYQGGCDHALDDPHLVRRASDAILKGPPA